jgi:hypothetical protein
MDVGLQISSRSIPFQAQRKTAQMTSNAFLRKLGNLADSEFYKRLRKRGARLLRNQYHLLTTGGFECVNRYAGRWGENWKDPSKAKVLLLAPQDYAGSFYGWAKAVNKISPDAACRLVSLTRHRYEFDCDYIFHVYERGVEKTPELVRMVDEADALHLKDESYFRNANYRPAIYRLVNSMIEKFRRDNKPIIYTHFGSIARGSEQDPAYRQAVREFDARIALTPDLNFDWFQGHLIPHAIDLGELYYSWRETRRLAHSPSSLEIKGSNLMWEAVNEIDEIRQNWELDLIAGVKLSKCLERKQKAELFFDQAGKNDGDPHGRVIGWYGKSAVEAMAFGIPSIAHLSEEAFQGCERAGKNLRHLCPILNTGLDRAAMKETVLKYLTLTGSEKEELSQRTRAFVEKFHGEDVVGRELGKVYRESVNSR